MNEKTINFIKKAQQIHGSRYDYSHVEYVNAKTKVEIICPDHGPFMQTPDKHTGRDKCGCPMCAGNRPGSTESFVKSARRVHGDVYDYSMVAYNGNKTKVEIICPVHGAFWQTPSNHLSGRGCAECANNTMLTKSAFVARARAVHGDTYDYSQVEYAGNRTAVKIVCKSHGVFEQIPYVHLSGCGCPICGRTQQIVSRDEAAIRSKVEATIMSRYGVRNPMYDPAVREKQLAAMRSKEVNDKRTATKRKNGSFNTSLCENRLFEKLAAIFGPDDVFRNYESEQYPFKCDFYIRSRDLYVELNAHWSHGGHWYSDVDLETVSAWRQKSKYYANAAETFSVRDVIKRSRAKESKLNYVVFWKMDLSDANIWFSTGCPDGRDWDHEYSWMM